MTMPPKDPWENEGTAQSPYAQTPYDQAPPPQQGGGKAIASMVIGIICLLAWCLPICGIPLTIVGLVLGIQDLKSPNRGMAIAGVVMCAIGLVLSLINAAVGLYLAATGQHPLVGG